MMKKLSLILTEQILIEGRLEDAKKKYPNIDDDFIDRLYGIDSSGNGKYLDWSLKMVSNLPSDDYSFDPIKMMDSVNYFHENQQSFKEKDINQYTLGSLTKAVDEVYKKKEEKKEKKNIDKIYDDEKYLVVVPKTHSASCTYGAGTKWCITMRDSDNHWKRETSNAIMYFIFDKERTKEDNKYKVALQYFRNSRKKWWDAEDSVFNGLPNMVHSETNHDNIRSMENMMSKIEEHKEEHLPPLSGGSEMAEIVATILGVDVDDVTEDGGNYYGMELFVVDNEVISGTYAIGTSDQWEDAAHEYYSDLFYDEDEAIHYVSDLRYFVYVTDTDRRMIASEESQYYANEVYDDDELMEHSDKVEEMTEITDEIDEIDSEMYDLNQDAGYASDQELKDIEEKIEEFEQRLKNLNTEKETMIEDAREWVREEKYDEVYEGLDDPLYYYVDEMGMYSTNEEAFKNSDFIQLDTETLIREYTDNFDAEQLTSYSSVDERVGGTYYTVSEIDY